MAATNCPVLLAGRDSSVYVVRVIGRGTLGQSATLQAFGRQCLDDPAATLVVDLSACEYLDSSFLGTLVALHRAASAGQFRVRADVAARRRLLASARLDQFLDCDAQDHCASCVEFTELASAPMDLVETARHALEAHRRLAEIDGPHAAACSHVANRLERELAARPGAVTELFTPGGPPAPS